ncbi:hypothetical protein PG988_010700 [Apiospora saccharicola]
MGVDRQGEGTGTGGRRQILTAVLFGSRGMSEDERETGRLMLGAWVRLFLFVVAVYLMVMGVRYFNWLTTQKV